MYKGQSKDGVVVLERFTMKEIARYGSVMEAAADLDLKAASIRRAINGHVCAFDCYWVYASELDSWMPKKTWFRRVNGNKTSPRLRELIESLT